MSTMRGKDVPPRTIDHIDRSQLSQSFESSPDTSLDSLEPLSLSRQSSRDSAVVQTPSRLQTLPRSQSRSASGASDLQAYIVSSDDDDSDELGTAVLLSVQPFKLEKGRRQILPGLMVKARSGSSLADFQALVYGELSKKHNVDRARSPLAVKIKGDVLFKNGLELSDHNVYAQFWATVKHNKLEKAEASVQVFDSGDKVKPKGKLKSKSNNVNDDDDDDDSSDNSDAATPAASPRKKAKMSKTAPLPELSAVERAMEDLHARYVCKDDKCSNRSTLCYPHEGRHIPISLNQQRRWAAGLAHEPRTTTIAKPPNDKLFDGFFRMPKSPSSIQSSGGEDMSLGDICKLAMASLISNARQQPQQTPIVCMPMPAAGSGGNSGFMLPSSQLAAPTASSSAAQPRSAVPSMSIERFLELNSELSDEAKAALAAHKIRRTTILEIALSNPEHRKQLGLEVGPLIELETALRSLPSE